MALYGERRRRTALIHLDRAGGIYRRSDVLSMLETTVGLRMVEAVGQLQNNCTWEVVFKNEETKEHAIMQDVYVKQHRATIADFHRQTQRLRVVRVPTCVPNEFLSAKLKEVDVTVKHIAHEINAADGLMSNVRIATIECKSVNAVPDTLRWGFDGLTGVALLFIKGRPPRCHRCGARGHKVAECTSPRTYASTMRGDMDVDGDDYDNDDNDNEEERGRAQASQPTGETTAKNQEQRPTDQPTEMATAHSVDDGAGVTAERPEAEATAAAAAATDERMESEQSGSDGDGDGESSAAESEASAAEFKQPRAHLRRRKRANKRNVERGSTGSDTNGLSKKAKVPESASDSEVQSTGRAERVPSTTTDELDPTTGRRNSRTKIPSGRRPPRAEIDLEQS